jgi:hypothetical protein
MFCPVDGKPMKQMPLVEIRIEECECGKRYLIETDDITGIYIQEQSDVPESLICPKCSSLLTGSQNLVPLISDRGEIYSIGCIHQVPNLHYHRTLSPEEHKLFDSGADAVIDAFKSASKKSKEV